MNSKKKVGILFNPKIQAAADLAQKLVEVAGGMDAAAWVCSSWDEERAREHLVGTGLLVCLGGDGTILRAARVIGQSSVPILGINLGRIGFMTELKSEDAMDHVPAFIQGDGWIEERAMIQAELVTKSVPPFYALNDVVVGRGGKCRLVRVEAKVDGEIVTKYKSDGVIVATATGSTGYSLASGGPILHPAAREIVLQPIAPHLSFDKTLILPSDAVVELEVGTTHEALLSIDGQIEEPLSDNDIVKIRRSPYVTRLMRSKHSASFYRTLLKKLEKRE